MCGPKPDVGAHHCEPFRAGARDAAAWHYALDRNGRWLVAALSALFVVFGERIWRQWRR
jgi:hypothetical protein